MGETKLSALSIETLEAATYVKNSAGKVFRLITLTTIPVGEVSQVVNPLDSREAEDLEKQCYGIEPASGLPCFQMAIIDPA